MCSAAASNGCFFNLGARLARFTGDDKYSTSAEEVWDWMFKIGLIDNEDWYVYDGGQVGQNCSDINRMTFSYVMAMVTEGAAFMYNLVSRNDQEGKRVGGRR